MPVSRMLNIFVYSRQYQEVHICQFICDAFRYAGMKSYRKLEAMEQNEQNVIHDAQCISE